MGVDSNSFWKKEGELRRVARTQVGNYWVSTMSLGIFGNGYETAIFEGKEWNDAGYVGVEAQYNTRKEAVAGHEDIVRRLETESHQTRRPHDNHLHSDFR